MAYDRRLQEQADKKGWNELRAKLVVQAFRIQRKRRIPESECTAEEISQEAITRVIAGERKWGDGEPQLMPLLVNTVRSLYSDVQRRHLARETGKAITPETNTQDSVWGTNRDYLQLKSKYDYLKTIDPKLAAFFRQATDCFLRKGCNTEGEAARMLGIAQSTYTTRKQRIWEIMRDRPEITDNTSGERKKG